MEKRDKFPSVKIYNPRFFPYDLSGPEGSFSVESYWTASNGPNGLVWTCHNMSQVLDRPAQVGVEVSGDNYRREAPLGLDEPFASNDDETPDNIWIYAKMHDGLIGILCAWGPGSIRSQQFVLSALTQQELTDCVQNQLTDCVQNPNWLAYVVGEFEGMEPFNVTYQSLKDTCSVMPSVFGTELRDGDAKIVNRFWFK